MRRMLSCEQLVTIYLGDERPLPTPLLLLLLEFSGMVHRGQRSMSFCLAETSLAVSQRIVIAVS